MKTKTLKKWLIEFKIKDVYISDSGEDLYIAFEDNEQKIIISCDLAFNIIINIE